MSHFSCMAWKHQRFFGRSEVTWTSWAFYHSTVVRYSPGDEMRNMRTNRSRQRRRQIGKETHLPKCLWMGYASLVVLLFKSLLFFTSSLTQSFQPLQELSLILSSQARNWMTPLRWNLFEETWQQKAPHGRHTMIQNTRCILMVWNIYRQLRILDTYAFFGVSMIDRMGYEETYPWMIFEMRKDALLDTIDASKHRWNHFWSKFHDVHSAQGSGWILSTWIHCVPWAEFQLWGMGS